MHNTRFTVALDIPLAYVQDWKREITRFEWVFRKKPNFTSREEEEESHKLNSISLANRSLLLFFCTSTYSLSVNAAASDNCTFETCGEGILKCLFEKKTSREWNTP